MGKFHYLRRGQSFAGWHRRHRYHARQFPERVRWCHLAYLRSEHRPLTDLLDRQSFFRRGDPAAGDRQVRWQRRSVHRQGYLRRKPVLVRFIWTVNPKESKVAAKWEQAFSPDGGRTWETNWKNELIRDDHCTPTDP